MRLQAGDPPAPTLALAAAVALHEALSAFAGAHSPELLIKWPNDLIVDGAKLAGILLEREGDAVIAGFGANLVALPEHVDRPATSLAILTGTTPDADALLDALASRFAHWLGIWRREGLAPVRTQWLQAAHPAGTPLITADGAGLFDGLDESGALRLRSPEGQVRLVHAGDVFLI